MSEIKSRGNRLHDKIIKLGQRKGRNSYSVINSNCLDQSVIFELKKGTEWLEKKTI